MLKSNSTFIPLIAGISFVSFALGSLFSKRLFSSSTNDSDANETEYPEEVKSELTSRVRTFFGDNEFNELKSSFVVVDFYYYSV
jgi:hypothetical protein